MSGGHWGGRAWNWLPITRLPWWAVIVVAIAMVLLDYLTGPYYQMPSTYVLLIVVVAWTNGAAPAVALAVGMPITRPLLMHFAWNNPWDQSVYVATAVTRVAAWTALAIMTSRLAHHERMLRTTVARLESLLPICPYCHRIHAATDRWETLDTYAPRNEHQFSPSLCPSCAQARFPEHFPPSGES